MQLAKIACYLFVFQKWSSLQNSCFIFSLYPMDATHLVGMREIEQLCIKFSSTALDFLENSTWPMMLKINAAPPDHFSEIYANKLTRLPPWRQQTSQNWELGLIRHTTISSTAGARSRPTLWHRALETSSGLAFSFMTCAFLRQFGFNLVNLALIVPTINMWTMLIGNPYVQQSVTVMQKGCQMTI